MPNPICPICAEDLINKNDSVVSLGECGHTFHSTCLNGWKQISNGCLICKSDMDDEYNEEKRTTLSTLEDIISDPGGSSSTNAFTPPSTLLKKITEIKANEKDPKKQITLLGSVYKELNEYFSAINYG